VAAGRGRIYDVRCRRRLLKTWSITLKMMLRRSMSLGCHQTQASARAKIFGFSALRAPCANLVRNTWRRQAMYNLTILRLKTRRSNEVLPSMRGCYQSMPCFDTEVPQAASGWLRHRNISTALSGGVYTQPSDAQHVSCSVRRK
jgi:hypothetical protein